MLSAGHRERGATAILVALSLFLWEAAGRQASVGAHRSFPECLRRRPGRHPAICQRFTFDDSTQAPHDWDGDGNNDEPESWEHLSACLGEYVTGAHTTPLFLETLEESPRFGYVPQFWGDSFGSGNSWLNVRTFRATWLQGTWWKKGGKVTVFHPGEPGTFTAGGKWGLIQVSGIIIPDTSLPGVLRGKAPPGGGVNPFEPELFR